MQDYHSQLAIGLPTCENNNDLSIIMESRLSPTMCAESLKYVISICWPRRDRRVVHLTPGLAGPNTYRIEQPLWLMYLVGINLSPNLSFRTSHTRKRRASEFQRVIFDLCYQLLCINRSQLFPIHHSHQL